MDKTIIYCLSLVCSLLFCSCYERISDNSRKLNEEIAIVPKIEKSKEIEMIPDSSDKLQSTIVPDTTINGKLKLNNYESFEVFYKDYKNIKTIDRIKESPIAPFSNKDKTQFLFVYQYEGDSKNAFSCFEIGYLKDNNFKLVYNDTDENTFETESGISLGMSLKELIDAKGKNYKVSTDSVISYRIDDYQKSKFLRKYNMPRYFLECKIVKSRINNIRIRFDYP